MKIVDKKRADYTPVTNPKNGEFHLPIGFFVLKNTKYKNISPLITIYGLGSCIALIIFDEIKKLSGMSHILLPKSTKKGSILYPHKYADLSVRAIISELIEHGGIKEHLKAIIIGGSNIFQNPYCTIGDDNIHSVKRNLDKFNVKIVREHVGGHLGRNVIFNPGNFRVMVNQIGENDYKLLYKGVK